MTNTVSDTQQQERIHCGHLIDLDPLDSLNLRANHGVYEPEETALCQQLINCGDHVLDIGANIGYYTLLFTDLVAPSGYVTAIEPDEKNFAYLQRNLTKQVANKSVSLHQVALGESTQKAQLFHAEDNTGMHRLYASVCCSDDSSEVVVIKGDSLELAPLDFIKIDIEGYEPAALSGLSETIKQSPNLKILCEFSPLSLWEAGFSPTLFLEEMRAMGLRLIVQDKKKWAIGDFDGMTLALKQIPQAAIAPLIDTLKHAENNATLNQRAADFLARHQYPRPLLENILLVADDAWNTVCNTLGIHGRQSASTETDNKRKWQCRWAANPDKNAFLALFQSAFGNAMPENLWDWKYARQNQYGVFAQMDGNIIAYYGGLPRQFWLNGKTQSAVQICDVMVTPKMRGLLTRKGPFIHTADTFLRSKTGHDNMHHFAFGFPTERHARIGEKSAWYTRTDAFLEASWSATNTLPPWFKIRPLADNNTKTVEMLWKTMQASLPNHLLPIKNSAFFKWRYKDHPERHYPSYVVSWRGINKVVGIVTLRDHGEDLGMEIMDLLAPALRLKTLHIAAQKICLCAGHTRLFSWMTPAILSSLPKPDQHTEVTGVYVTPEYQQMIEQKQVNCWLMSGDTDFR